MARHLQKIENGWRYYRAVPRQLRPVVGRTAWSTYLGKAYGERDAERYARDQDAIHDATIARLSKLSKDDRAKITAAGTGNARGLKSIKNAATDAEAISYFTREIEPDAADALLYFLDIVERDLQTVDPRTPRTDAEREFLANSAAVQIGPRKPVTPLTEVQRQERAALRLFTAKKDIENLRTEIAERSSLAGNMELRNDRGLGALMALSQSETDKGKSRTRTYLERFITHLGSDREPGAVGQLDVVGWRDAMKNEGMSLANQSQILGKLSALFATALSDGKIAANPFAGIMPRGKAKKVSDKKRAFKPHELKAYVEAASAEKRVTDFALIVECMIFSGARSSEICGLRVCDVRKEASVLVFDFNDEVRRLKNEASVRLTPVASPLVARLAALTKGRSGSDWLFNDLPRKNEDSAEHQFQNIASKLLRDNKIAVREVNGVAVRDKRLTAHGTRALWTQTADKLRIDENVTYAVLGHAKGKDVHSRAYKDRPPVKTLKAGVERVAAAIGKMV